MESRRPEITGSRSILKKLWKHSFFYVFIPAALLLLLAVFAAGIYLIWFHQIRSVPPPPDVGRIRPLLKNGDVILRSGVGLWSELFRSRNVADHRFSHVGIVSIGGDGLCRVIHAEADDLTGDGRVGIDTLEHFVGESSSVGISRLHAGDPNLLAEYAASFVGRPFDWKFNRNEDAAVYCTELIDLSLRKIDPALRLPDDRGIILPEACLIPEYFTEIPVGP